MEANKIVKASVWYTVSNIVMNGIMFVMIPFFSRILTKQEFGEYSNITSWISILIYIGTLSLASAYFKGRLDFPNDIKSFIWSLLVLGSLYTVILFVIISSNIDFFENIFSMKQEYIYFIFAYLLVYPAYDFFQVQCRFEYRYKIYVLINALITILNVALSFILVWHWEDRLWARILGMYSPTMIVSVCLYVYYLKNRAKIKIQYWKYALPISIPLVAHLLAGTVLNSSDRIMIKYLVGSSETAMYSMAYNCALVLSILCAAINMAITPWFSDNIFTENYNEVRMKSKKYIICICTFAVFFMLIAPEVLYVLGGREYEGAKNIIPIVILAYVIDFVCTMLTIVEQCEGKTYMILVGTILAMLVNIGLNIILIPRYGYEAAAVTTVAGYIVMLAVHMFFLNRLNKLQIYDFRFVFIILGIMVVISLFSLYLYSITILRIVVILLFITVLFRQALKNKEIILKLLKRTI